VKNPLSHFEIYADDPQALAGFYSAMFDWKIEAPPGTGGYLVTKTVEVDAKTGRPTQPGGINGGILKRPDKNAPRVINYVHVESVDRAIERAQGLGAKVHKAKSPVAGMGWYAILFDPQGNAFAVWQPDAAAK
jgi:predicted enzyme related to lactoylglutathione lyase